MSRASVMTALEDIGPMTCKELALLLNVTDKTVGGTLQSLRRDGYLYIKGWEIKPKGRPAAIHAIGEEPDAPRPGRMDKKMKNARQYARRVRLQALKEVGVWGGLL